MEPSENPEEDFIDEFEAVRLLINVYQIKKLKSVNKPVNQEKFIDNVHKEFRNRAYSYSRKKILYTWKNLLDTYQFYKQNFTNEPSAETWSYFTLMDNCFDDSKQTSEKFKDSKWTFFLIESLSKYKSEVLRRGLTMDILQFVEDDFRNAGSTDITQKDIHTQWVFLRRFYRQNQKTGYYQQLIKNNAYFAALRQFFETETGVKSPQKQSANPNLYENELFSAIESIKEEEVRETKRQKTDHKKKKKTAKSKEGTASISLSPEQNVAIENVPVNRTVPFNIVQHDILLQYLKRNKTKIQNNDGNINEALINEALKEFEHKGYNVTYEEISNEWNDLSCRYELIKNSEHPEKWTYYKDMNYICNSDQLTDQANLFDNFDNQSTIGSIIVENIRKNQPLKDSEYTELTERLLNVYESSSKEFLEIKDILLERNLHREESNYLLNVAEEKLRKRKKK